MSFYPDAALIPPPTIGGIPAVLITANTPPGDPGADNISGSNPVLFLRAEVNDRMEQWTRINAAITGSDSIKKLRTKVLPMPNPSDVSAENLARYYNYSTRAVWYNVSGRTLQGLVGYVFQKDPTITLPAALEPLEENIDGSGVSLVEQAKAALRMVLAFGRAGLLVDYPRVSGPTTQQEANNGNINPTIVIYKPWQVRNWNFKYVGAKATLVLLVLQETYDAVKADGFTICTEFQYRVITLGDSGVQGVIYRKTSDGGTYQIDPSMSYTPTDVNGNNLKEIPFVFLGSEANDGRVDDPPLGDLVDLNIAHFRNSADYEESCFICGQPTPWFSGLTNEWVKDVWGGKIQLGSRSAIPLPQGAQAGMLQVAENTMPFEAMKQKEEQMRSIGARLVEQKAVVRTATEVMVDSSAEVSTLTAAATNVFRGYRTALDLCGVFVVSGTTDVEFDLSEPLNRDTITPQMADALVGMWTSKILDYTEVRWALKRSGLAFMEDKDVFSNVNKMQFDAGAAILPPRETVAAPAAPKPPAPQPKK